MRRFIVYKVVCSVDGKGYIGLTTATLRRRWREHISKAIKGQSHHLLHAAIREHGVEAFSCVELAEAASGPELRVMERGLIAAHGTYRPHGYNSTAGGQGTFQRVVTPEQRAALSERAKRQFSSAEARRKVSEDRKRYFSDPAVIAVCRERTLRQHSDPEYVRRKIEKIVAISRTPEKRAERSAIMKRYFSDPDNKAAFDQALRRRRFNSRQVSPSPPEEQEPIPFVRQRTDQ